MWCFWWSRFFSCCNTFVQAMFKLRGVPLITVDARELFLGRLAGISDPETKRKIIGLSI